MNDQFSRIRTMSSEYAVSELNRIKRVAKRGHYDRTTVHSVIDAALIAHVGFQQDQRTLIIPMFHARWNDSVLFHGATTSRLMQFLSSGETVCLAFSLVDGIVLAKSLFHHSMNYRSAVVFGRGRRIESDDDKLAALQVMTQKIMPGRWDDARLPTDQELKATAVVAVEIETGSAKIRTGGPVDDPEDLSLPHWSGVVPIRRTAMAPLSSEPPIAHGATPEYLDDYLRHFNTVVNGS